MHSEPNTSNSDSIFSKFFGYILSQISSDSAELKLGGEEDKPEEKPADEQEDSKTSEDSSTESKKEQKTVDLESEEVKAAITAKVEEIVGGRVAREKEKTTEAVKRAEAAEKKLEESGNSVAELTRQLEEAKSEGVAAKFEAMTFKLSAEEGVSVDLIKNLKGDTEEDLRAAIQLISEASQKKSSVDRIFSGKGDGVGVTSSISEIALKAAKAARSNR